MSKPTQELVALRLALTAKMAAIKSEVADIDAALTHLALPTWTDKLRLSGKEHGSLKLVVDGVPLQGEVKKTVKWDSDLLKEAASKCSGEDAAFIFTVTLSVSEEQVKMLEEFENPILADILLARSVNYSAFKATPAKA